MRHSLALLLATAFALSLLHAIAGEKKVVDVEPLPEFSTRAVAHRE